MLSFSETFQNKSKIISRRMFVLSALKLAVFVSIISRLFYLQISENIKYRSLSDKNRLREWKVAPQRGIIEDYFGNKMEAFVTIQNHFAAAHSLAREELTQKAVKVLHKAFELN